VVTTPTTKLESPLKQLKLLKNNLIPNQGEQR
jgi:hypothetical protein